MTPIQLSSTSAAIGAALAAAQGEMAHAAKDAKNPHFRSTYATLAAVIDAVRPALARHKIAIVQSPEVEGRVVHVATLLLHESGEYIGGVCSAEAKDGSPQAVGSTITYLRRYGLQALAGIAAEDDDGEAAQPRRPVSDPTPAGADLAALRRAVVALDIEPAQLEEYCASIGRPWGELTSAAAGKLVQALAPNAKFRSEYEKWRTE